MIARFTLDGGDMLENRLAALCARARERVIESIGARRIHAVALGGGYGRGEGGVLRTPGGDQPYNDLEFYVLLKKGTLFHRARLEASLRHAGEMLSLEAGLEVEFKALTLSKLQRAPVTMFYYDLISGHRTIFGDDSWPASCQHHRAAHRIPLHEATRLLLNRCSGLLFASDRLNRAVFDPDDADFAGRNLAKAKLAMGDVLLTLRGQYHWSCRERHRRLRKIAGTEESFRSILPLHEQGVEFKLHPRRESRSRDALGAELEFLKSAARDLWLFLESKRLATRFATIEEYAFSRLNKCPETKSWRNRLINARTFGLGGLLDAAYPRQRLLNALPILLWQTSRLAEPTFLRFAQAQLRTRNDDFAGLVRAYEMLWRRFN